MTQIYTKSIFPCLVHTTAVKAHKCHRKVIVTQIQGCTQDRQGIAGPQGQSNPRSGCHATFSLIFHGKSPRVGVYSQELAHTDMLKTKHNINKGGGPLETLEHGMAVAMRI